MSNVREALVTLSLTKAALLVRGFSPRTVIFADFLYTYIIEGGGVGGVAQRAVLRLNESKKTVAWSARAPSASNTYY